MTKFATEQQNVSFTSFIFFYCLFLFICFWYPFNLVILSICSRCMSTFCESHSHKQDVESFSLIQSHSTTFTFYFVRILFAVNHVVVIQVQSLLWKYYALVATAKHFTHFGVRLGCQSTGHCVCLEVHLPNSNAEFCGVSAAKVFFLLPWRSYFYRCGYTV